MSNLLIPLTSEEAYYEQQVRLEGTTYLFRLLWNSTYGYWALSIYDETGGLILAGLRLVIGVELIARYKLPTLPPGYLITVDFTDRLLRIGRETFDGDARLCYQESA